MGAEPAAGAGADVADLDLEGREAFLEESELRGRRMVYLVVMRVVVGRAERRRAEFWSQDCAVGRYGIVLLSSRGQVGAEGGWEL